MGLTSDETPRLFVDTRSKEFKVSHSELVSVYFDLPPFFSFKVTAPPSPTYEEAKNSPFSPFSFPLWRQNLVLVVLFLGPRPWG